MSSSEARIFARALYEILFDNTLKQLHEVAAKLDGPLDRGTVRERIAAALPPSVLPEVRNFLMVLANENALGELPAIIEAFATYGQGETQQFLSGEVVSAVELNEAQRQHIADDLSKRYSQTIDLEFAVDPSLIGGLIIRVGDQVLDNSLRTRLSLVQRNMMAN